MVLAAVLAASDLPVAPVLILMALGVVIATFGHAAKMQNLVVLGLAMLFLATAAMVVGAYVAYERGETDTREERDPREPTF
jgi:Na+/serine symporter